MKGLIVKSTTWNGETCKIGMPGGRVGMAVNAMERSNYCYWSIGGYHKEEELHWTWKGGTLRVGDKIEIEFAEFDEDEATPPVVKYPHSCPTPQKDDSPEAWQFKLKTYQRLKKILEDEGLIEKEP